jgi:hypothetical protein
MPDHPNFRAFQLDNLDYGHDETTAWPFAPSSRSVTKVFPRNLVCSASVMLAVQEVRCLASVNSADSIVRTACIRSSINILVSGVVVVFRQSRFRLVLDSAVLKLY